MATPVINSQTIVGLEEESTEGTYVAPQATTSYFQPLADNNAITPSKELLERSILTNGVGKATPKTGTKGVTGSFGVEMRASGTEGGEPDYHSLMVSCLGGESAVGSQFTTSTGNTTTVLNGTNIHTTYDIGDGIVILDSGDHTIHVVTDNTTTDEITYSPARTGAVPDSTLVSQNLVYSASDTSTVSLSISKYIGNEIRQSLIGGKVTSMSLDNFSTGQLASFNFGLEGLSFTQIDGAAPHTPAFDTGTPPIILNACIYQDGTQLDINSFTLNVSNTLGAETATCDSNGKKSFRITDRVVTGTINPYLDDTTFAQFTHFDSGTTFSLIASAYIPSSTTGEITLGSVVVFYMPTCFVTEYAPGDQEGLATDDMTFQATAGADGTGTELYITLI